MRAPLSQTNAVVPFTQFSPLLVFCLKCSNPPLSGLLFFSNVLVLPFCSCFPHRACCSLFISTVPLNSFAPSCQTSGPFRKVLLVFSRIRAACFSVSTALILFYRLRPQPLAPSSSHAFRAVCSVVAKCHRRFRANSSCF